MAKIADIKKGDTTLYPRTVAQAVAVSGNTLDEELNKKANTEDLVFVSGTGEYSQASYYGYKGVKTLNVANGECAHAEGFKTIASGPWSHAEGAFTTASGGYSHAEGASTMAGGVYTHTEGGSTIATNLYEHAQGCCNLSITASNEKEKTLHSVGNGSSTGDRHNAVELKFNGDYYIQEKTSTDDSTVVTAQAPMKRLQTWLNEKADKSELYTTVETVLNLANPTFFVESGKEVGEYVFLKKTEDYIGITSKAYKLSVGDKIVNKLNKATPFFVIKTDNEVLDTTNSCLVVASTISSTEQSFTVTEEGYYAFGYDVNYPSDYTDVVIIRKTIAYLTDIQLNSKSIVENGVANIPIASSTQFGVVKEWVGTQTEFDALTTIDENTNYYVV